MAMDALSPAKLAKPMDRSAMSNDVATLRNLVGMLNNSKLTGAVVPPEEQATKTEEPAPVVLEKRAFVPPLPSPGYKFPPGTNKIFFTGGAKAGKNFLASHTAARVFELDDPIRSMAVSAFGTYREESYSAFAKEVYAWGEGIESKEYPLTAARAMFSESIRGLKQEGLLFSEFGRAGFWSNMLLARVARFNKEFPGELVVVTDVGTVEQYKALQQSGFSPVHVMANTLTREKRGSAANASALSAMVERSVTQKISQQPNGGKLWCVWCDENYPLPSSRMLTVAEFVAALK
jgi:hypothetical protein